MAYDANDPADRQIVADAVAEALEEARTQHEADIEGLKTKNKDLLTKLARARAAGGEGSAEEVTRLESELETTQANLRDAQAKLRTAERDLRTASSERDTARTALETETTYSRNQTVENGLTAALVEANVAPHFMEAAKALLMKQGVAVKVEGESRMAVGPDHKPLNEFVKAWAASDTGKHYVTAPANGGGGSNGVMGGGSPGTKKLADMSEQERLDFARAKPTEFQQLLNAEGPTPVSAAA